jgi:hypothetical protein
LVAVASLLWNSVGAFDFLMTQTRNKAYMASFSQAQLDFYYGFPAWVMAAWGIAVWGGVLGSLMLLIRRRQALPLFLASLICLVLTDVRNLGFTDGLKVMGGAQALAITAVIFAIAVLLLVYARSMRRRGVLR